MIGQIESLLASESNWADYLDLYHHVKSSIHYAFGLQGRFNSEVPYNIETLVNTLYELERNEDHPLYPFIASWNSRFMALAGYKFEAVQRLRILILQQLKQWMCPDDSRKADYYRGLVRLQRDLNFPLRIFSLNYDLLVEGLQADTFRVETGFEALGANYPWDWTRFEDSENAPSPLPEAFLYKLHGSIDWKRDEVTKNLFRVPQIATIAADRMEVIFGRDFKLEAADPYLFYAYAFRKFSLDARLIVALGYGFGDAHINKMLTQCLRATPHRKILAVTTCSDGTAGAKRDEVAKHLEISKPIDQISVEPVSVESFLSDSNLSERLLKLLPPGEDLPF